MEFNDRLRAMLSTREWNQKRLADELGSPASTVSQWINGQRTPEGEQLRRVADLLGVDPQWLRGGEGPEPRDLRRRARSMARELVKWIARRAPVDGGRDGGNANQFTIRASIANLVREAIQNAVDEWLGHPHGPVRVRFRLLSLRGEAKRRYLEAMQWEEQLRPHVEACVEQSGDQQVAGGLEEALRMADTGELLILQISDSNTRGLIGPETDEGNFAALTRDNLFSEKNSEKAGGSYGLGKAMQYAASAFGCVIFSSDLSDPEPETGNTHGRLFARAELVYHRLDGGERFSGPMWLGREREGADGEPISYWAEDERDALLRDLHMVRSAGDTGTTIAIVGMRDLDADRPRPPREMVEEMANAAERSFWPAIEAGELEVRVQYVEIDDPDDTREPEFDQLVDPAQSRAVGPYVAAVRAHRIGETDEMLIGDGDVVCSHVPLNIPARRMGDDRHGALTHDALVLVRRATPEEEADDVSRREFRRGVLMRGSDMVVKTLDLSRGSLGAQAFQVVVLAGLAASDDEAALRAEVFLRAAEPPSHDDWEYTPRLRRQYEPGARKALSDFELAIRREVRRVLQFESEQAPDGPRDLSQRFKFGDPSPPERAPRIVVRTQSIDDDGAWRVEAAVRLRGDLRHGLVGRPQLVFLGESGGRSRVRWRELEPVGTGIAVGNDGLLVISPQTRTAKFRGVTDPDTHPAPASQATATLLFQPIREEA
jgi:transcriptional regulator with XRE-family HTH domain